MILDARLEQGVDAHGVCNVGVREVLNVVVQDNIGILFFKQVDELRKLLGIHGVVAVNNLEVFAACLADTDIDRRAVTAVFLIDQTNDGASVHRGQFFQGAADLGSAVLGAVIDDQNLQLVRISLVKHGNHGVIQIFFDIIRRNNNRQRRLGGNFTEIEIRAVFLRRKHVDFALDGVRIVELALHGFRFAACDLEEIARIVVHPLDDIGILAVVFRLAHYAEIRRNELANTRNIRGHDGTAGRGRLAGGHGLRVVARGEERDAVRAVYLPNFLVGQEFLENMYIF